MFLAWRELKYAKLRYLLIAVIMILIAWLVMFVSGLANGLSSDNASAIQNMPSHYLVLQQDSDNRLTRSTLTESNLKAVRSSVSEQDSAPLGVQMSTVTKDGSERKIDVTYFAVDMSSMLAPKLVTGSSISNASTNEVIADASLQESGIKLGDQIEDQASGQAFTVVGFSEGQSFSHTPVVHINFQQWASIKTNKLAADDTFNAIALNANDAAANKIRQADGVSVISKAEALQGIPGYKEEQGSLLMMIAFLFIIAAFVLAVFFYVITIQKMNQFGVLKAIGASTSYLARNIIAQVLALAVTSLVISIALTYGVSSLLPDSMPFELGPELITGCSLLFLLVSILGSLLSMYRVAKIEAIEAIGRTA